MRLPLSPIPGSSPTRDTVGELSTRWFRRGAALLRPRRGVLQYAPTEAFRQQYHEGGREKSAHSRPLPPCGGGVWGGGKQFLKWPRNLDAAGRRWQGQVCRPAPTRTLPAPRHRTATNLYSSPQDRLSSAPSASVRFRDSRPQTPGCSPGPRTTCRQGKFGNAR